MRLSSIAFFVAAQLACGANASADTLITPTFEVTITVNCSEGEVDCSDVTYQGKNRKSGQSITLRGSTWHSKCADGATPCRFLGYQFRNGNVQYLVASQGLLRVTQGKKLLVEEQGEWNYEAAK